MTDAEAFALWARTVGRPYLRQGHLSYPHAIDVEEARMTPAERWRLAQMVRRITPRGAEEEALLEKALAWLEGELK